VGSTRLVGLLHREIRETQCGSVAARVLESSRWVSRSKGFAKLKVGQQKLGFCKAQGESAEARVLQSSWWVICHFCH